jgi:hypothetical protein
MASLSVRQQAPLAPACVKSIVGAWKISTQTKLYAEYLCRAKIPSGGGMSVIDQLGGYFGSSFQVGIGCLVIADENEMKAKHRARCYRARLSRWSSSISLKTNRGADSGSQFVTMMQAAQP